MEVPLQGSGSKCVSTPCCVALAIGTRSTPATTNDNSFWPFGSDFKSTKIRVFFDADIEGLVDTPGPKFLMCPGCENRYKPEYILFHFAECGGICGGVDGTRTCAMCHQNDKMTKREYMIHLLNHMRAPNFRASVYGIITINIPILSELDENQEGIFCCHGCGYCTPYQVGETDTIRNVILHLSECRGQLYSKKCLYCTSRGNTYALYDFMLSDHLILEKHLNLRCKFKTNVNAKPRAKSQLPLDSLETRDRSLNPANPSPKVNRKELVDAFLDIYKDVKELWPLENDPAMMNCINFIASYEMNH